MKHPEIVRQGWIQDLPLHNFLVLLYHLARIPMPLCALLVAGLLLPTALLYPSPLWASVVLGLAGLADLTLLALLPRLGLSYGWIQPPWLLFAAGRGALAAMTGVLPLSATSGLLALGAGQLLLGGLAVYASVVEPFRVGHTRLRHTFPGLRRPLRLLLITDLHVERLTRRERLVLRQVERERPDLILLGGDLLNLSYVGEPRAVADARRFLAALHAPLGLFLVRGTVDVDAPHVVLRVLDGLPHVRMLENERIAVGGIELVGIPADADHETLCRRLVELVRGADGPVICLHHTPDLVEQAAGAGVQLYLAGHTHGGQICLPLLGPLATASRFGRRYVRGAHRLDLTLAYVCRGLGLEGLGAPRMRFLAPPELVWITLEPGQNSRETG